MPTPPILLDPAREQKLPRRALVQPDPGRSSPDRKNLKKPEKT